MLNSIETAGTNHVITMVSWTDILEASSTNLLQDLHASQLQGFFNVPVGVSVPRTLFYVQPFMQNKTIYMPNRQSSGTSGESSLHVEFDEILISPGRTSTLHALLS